MTDVTRRKIFGAAAGTLAGGPAAAGAAFAYSAAQGHLVRRLYAGLGLSRRPGAPDGLQRTAFRLLVGRTAEARRLRRLRNCAQGGHAMCADKVGPYDAV